MGRAVGCVEDAFGGSMGGHDESESDLLPFVLDAEPTAMQAQLEGQGGAFGATAGAGGAAMSVGLGGGVGAAGGHTGGAVGGGGGKAGVAQKDVAVGAFLQMLQEAAAAPVGRMDRRQALWVAQQDRAEGPAVPVCVGDAALQVQELAAQLQQVLFPEP